MASTKYHCYFDQGVKKCLLKRTEQRQPGEAENVSS